MEYVPIKAQHAEMNRSVGGMDAHRLEGHIGVAGDGHGYGFLGVAFISSASCPAGFAASAILALGCLFGCGLPLLLLV